MRLDVTMIQAQNAKRQPRTVRLIMLYQQTIVTLTEYVVILNTAGKQFKKNKLCKLHPSKSQTHCE